MMQFVSIDFETANEKRFSPCAIGVVIADEHGIVDEFYSLINPLMTFTSFNRYIRGITKHDVADAPTFPELWPTLSTDLENKLVVAHNPSFDMSVLRNTTDYSNSVNPELDSLCSVNMYIKVLLELTNDTLNTVANYHAITFEHHQALEDARVAAEIFIKAMETQQTTVLEKFLENCHMTRGRVFERGYVPPRAKRKKQMKKITW